MKIKLLFVLGLFAFSPFVIASPNFIKMPQVDDPFVVVLDAGHGGHDPGNLGNGYLEKKIALNIVLKVGEILAQHENIKVIYTREDDTFVDLYVRGEIANKANADLFVSVHCDSHSSDANGAGTFVLGLHANKQNFEIAKKENSVIYLEDNYETRYADYDINSPESVIGLTIMQEEFLDQSIALAKMIQDNFSGKLKRKNRKVKQAGFIVLHQTFMPSVLVETGFLTNKNEGAYLNSKKGQAEMGKAIAEAILNYKKGVQANTVQDTGIPQTEEKITVVEKTVPKAIEKEPIPEKKEEVAIVPEKKMETPSTTKEESITKKVPTTTETTAENKSIIPDVKKVEDIIFKVQLMAGSKDLPLISSNFRGLGNISKEPYKDLFRYMYGETNSYSAAEKLKSNAVLKGYTTAYIVAYKGGERISVPVALKALSQ
ncbi:N-acetylmuramoyl-L-alanine amidase family protein [Maribacter sp. 2210JD10-5]|uniref:N-acetylmuramoyl-L-alanine amidase family protein n=1 Tax=Maribacter sp. 2210JD10-5 TaxID=3386272 RepID=UPI0039BD7F91